MNRSFISFTFGGKKIEEFDLVSLVVCGHDYGLEWKNNFLVGESGVFNSGCSVSNLINSSINLSYS